MYWSILKTFNNGKKIPVISPILINNKLVSNFKMKANPLIDFCFRLSPLDNNSKIPENETYITDSKLSSLHFEENNIIEKFR